MAAYLDHAASTPMRPEAVDAMVGQLRDGYANPSGAHRAARAARRAIDEVRDTIAELTGVEPGGIVFTSGGTEADNLAVFGVHDRVGGGIVASAVEHHAVLDPVVARSGRLVGVHSDGAIDLDALGEALDPEVRLVTVMLVNNEVGAVQPLRAVVALARELAPDAVVHTDAVQAATWLDVAAATEGVDLVSVSAHKFGGPKGVGALAIREGVEVAARQVGGGQERERRSGTPDVAGIVGMGVAARLAIDERSAVVDRVAALRERLLGGLRAGVPGLVETGAPTTPGNKATRHQVPGIVHVCIEGVESESLLYLLERDDVFASAASSCASGAMEPSHVLAAMGVRASSARGSLRLSLGWSSTDADVDAALAAVPVAVERLRRFAA
jgi:cysteine desulfurase